MRFIKLAVISVVALFTVMLLISLLLPSHVRISRAIDINADAHAIYPLISDVSQWQQWNEYIRAYSNKVVTSDMVKSDQTNIFIISRADSLVTAEWQQPSGNKFGSGFALVSNAGGGGHSTVQWYFDFHLHWYPWEKFQSIVYDEQLGPPMEKSLKALKKTAEASN